MPTPADPSRTRVAQRGRSNVGSSDGGRPKSKGVEGDTSAEHDATVVMESLRRIVRAARMATTAAEREVGVSMAQLFVLRQLALEPGQSLKELAARARTTQSSASEVAARLVKRGFVARRAATSDRRRAELTITPRGRTLLARAPETIQERLLEGLRRLDDAERHTLARGMESWLRASGLQDVPAT